MAFVKVVYVGHFHGTEALGVSQTRHTRLYRFLSWVSPIQSRVIALHGSRAAPWGTGLGDHRCLEKCLDSDEQQLRSKTGRQVDDDHCRLVTCRVEELHPHPSYVRHDLTVPASKLSALAELGDLAFREPIVITQDRAIVDGYARWDLARLQGRPALPCIEYELTEDEALHWILQRHRRSHGFSDFCRILLALELEPSLRGKAQSNQRAGGQKKGSSKLTEAERLDVRVEIATIAGVSVGNVSKVTQLMRAAHPELRQALRNGEISIHRAWLYSKERPDKQQEALGFHRGTKEIKRYVRNLISRHEAKSSPDIPDLNYLLRSMSALDASDLASVSVSVIKGPEKLLFVTEGLARALRPYQESIATCAIKIR